MEFVLFLNICMLGRLVYLFSDGSLSMPRWFGMISLQLLGLLCFDWHLMQLLCAALLGLVLILDLNVQPEEPDRHGLRLGSFIFLVFSASFAFGSDGLTLAAWVSDLGLWLETHSALIPSLPNTVWQQLNLIVFGLLLTANEINLAIRMVFHIFRLEPKKPTLVPDAATEEEVQTRQPGATALGPVSVERDEEEYNAGRVIGILERWLILLVVMVANQLAVVAFVMAAKSFARFKQLEEKSFAEYVLVGTLLSTFLTLVVALALSNYYFSFT